MGTPLPNAVNLLQHCDIKECLLNALKLLLGPHKRKGVFTQGAGKEITPPRHPEYFDMKHQLQGYM